MDEDYSYIKFVKDLWNTLPGSKLWFGAMLFLRMLGALGTLASLFLVGKIVDFFTSYQKGGSLQTVVVLVALMIIINVSTVLIRIYAKFNIQKTGLKMQQSLRLKGFRKLLSLDLSWHETSNSGTKIKRIMNGSSSVEGFMRLLSNDLAAILMGSTAVIVIFAFVSWKYLLFILVFAALFLIAEQHFAKRIYQTSRDLFIHEEQLSGKAQEISSNIVSVKSLGLHSVFNQSLVAQEKTYKQKWVDKKKAGLGKNRIVNIAIALGHGLFLLLVATDVLSGALSVGMLVVYLSYYSRFAAEITRYSNIAMEMIRFKAKFERLKIILDEPETKLDVVNGKLIDKNWKTILFDNVSFSYKKRNILDGFYLNIKRREKIGVVGLSGSGKSTLIKLFLRLYKPQKGSIKIGSTDLFSIKRNSLRSNLTVVLQDQELFNLSLKDNVLIAGKNGEDKLFKEAIRKSALSSVVNKLPQKEQTIIGEKGYRLSGGERQRLGIARAIYRNSDILILDEATSSLDSETEEFVQRSLESLNDKTVLVIAHRLATLRNVDRIVFVKDGRVAEEGSFRKLLAKKGLFYNLWKKQELS